MLEAALFKRKNLQRKNQSDLRIKKSSVKKLTYKSLPGLTRQVGLIKAQLLIYEVSACKANGHAGWRGWTLHRKETDVKKPAGFNAAG